MIIITWNVVTKNFNATESLLTHMRNQITQLEEYLQGLPPDSVHLLAELIQDLKTNRYSATLTLRLPRDILCAQEPADDLLNAFAGAINELRSQLESQKPERRGERLPMRARVEKEEAKETRFADQSQASGTGPRNYEDVVRDFLQKNYNRLLYHVKRHIQEYEATGELPKGAVDPKDIVDEVARQAEEKANERPPTVNWLVWLFHLMHQELRRQRDYYRRKEAGEIPTEKPVTVPELSEKKLHPLEQIVQKKMEPQVIRVEDVEPGSEMPPDEFAAQKERLEEMLPDLPRWPWIEREVCELYFVEGFEPAEIAKAMDQPVEKIQKIVDALRERVREQLLDHEEAHA